MEIIVVDDASSDRTCAVITGLASAIPLQFVSVPEHRGQAFCRNLGSQAARGEILAFIDSDCEAHPDWLRDLVPEFTDTRVAAVGGAVLPLADRHWLQRYEEVRSPLHQGAHPATVRPRTPVSYVAACNLLVRRQALLELGGFVIDRGEDVDLIWRLCKLGLNVRYRPVGKVLHDHRHRIREFVTRRAFYAGSEPILLRRHPENRRPLILPFGLVIAIAAGILALAATQRLLAPLMILPIAIEIAAVWRWALKRRLPIGLRALSRAIASRHLSALYYGGANVARYYALPLVLLSLAAGIFWAPARWLAVFVASCVFATAAADWYRLRPRLGPALFIVGHVLDTLAYHIGLLTACVRQRTFRPLAMDIRLVT